jgi:hypothetical protein
MEEKQNDLIRIVLALVAGAILSAGLLFLLFVLPWLIHKGGPP